MFNKTRSSIESKLSIPSLIIYVDELIKPYIIEKKYPSLQSLLSLRLVTQILLNPQIISDAFIKKNEDTFILTTKRRLKISNPHDNFLLAHEIAHTFLYEIKSDRILDTYTFVKSSFEQEYFCNFFARALLIPTDEIRNDFSSDIDKCSLKLFNKLSLKYNVPHSELLKRVLNDLELLENVVVIRFAKFPNEPFWKIYETFMSESIRYNKDYFIPSNNYRTNVKYFERFPTCFDKLSLFLSAKYDEIKSENEIELRDIDLEIFNGKPLKHFSKKMNNETVLYLTKSRLSKFDTDIINIMIKLK